MRTHSSVPGFTLVELLVTMAVFITVITIATGALFSAQVVNTRLEQTQAILDGVNLATEIMVRDIRYGSLFYCDTALPNPIVQTRRECAYPSRGTVLVFRPTIGLSGSTDPRQDRVAYYLVGGILYKNEYPYGSLVRTKQITSNDVNIQSLSFYSMGLQNTSNSDLNQPLITLVLSGVTIPKKAVIQPVSFSVQTSASSRMLDN
jgi:type II secretory pathway component PulJ